MDYTEYTAVKNRFTHQPNLCDLFKLLAVETWKRIEYAYLRAGVKVFETTLTQNIIFSINAYNDQFGLNIEIFEAADENTNGNDFELIIRFPTDGIEYYAPIQAKKVNRNGKYNSMDHGDQIESLIDYAKKNDSKPFYLLYNFSQIPLRIKSRFGKPFELSGCTLISAEYLHTNYYNQRVKRDGSLGWVIPDFYDLNPAQAFPWHEIACPSTSKEFFDKLKSKSLVSDDSTYDLKKLIEVNKIAKQGFYPLNTFKDDENWINIKSLVVTQETLLENTYTTLSDIDYSSAKNNQNNKKERRYPKFSPKSRVIISK